MPYRDGSFKTIENLTPAADGAVVNKLHAYTTNDTQTAVAASGYFNDAADHINTGDLILVSAGIDGTPAAKFYTMKNTSGVITVTAAA